jgi:hypothetical protein
MVEIAGYEIPNKPEELTIEQFDKINFITSNQEMDDIEKWIEKFKYLGVSEDAFDDMEMEEFYESIAKWNDQPPHPKEKVLSVEIDGYTYEAKPSIGVKDLGLIEKVWKQNTGNFAAETLAIIYKRSDLTKVEHYAPAHIKHKTALFKKQHSSLVIPYIIEVLEKLTKTTQQIKDAVTEELESTND